MIEVILNDRLGKKIRIKCKWVLRRVFTVYTNCRCA